jgi:hypothetical protein
MSGRSSTADPGHRSRSNPNLPASLYNWERPNQAIPCYNLPPRVAFPNLPKRPPLPTHVDPDRWLHAIHDTRYRRRISSNGTLTIDTRAYYVRQALKGQYVTIVVDARHRQLLVEHNNYPIKRIPIKGLYGELLTFEDYYSAMRTEARTHWRRGGGGSRCRETAGVLTLENHTINLLLHSYPLTNL